MYIYLILQGKSSRPLSTIELEAISDLARGSAVGREKQVYIYVCTYVYMCMYICIYTYIYIYIYAHIYVYTYVYIYMYINIYIYMYTFIQELATLKAAIEKEERDKVSKDGSSGGAGIYMYLCIFVYICLYIYVYIYIYEYAYIHTYIHTYMHTYIHTYILIYIYIHIKMDYSVVQVFLLISSYKCLFVWSVVRLVFITLII
jgi:hypothetical protein